MIHAQGSTGKRLTSPGMVGRYLVLSCASLFALLPILWGFSTSLKPEELVAQWPPQWLPAKITLANYVAAIADRGFVIYLRNTIVVAGCTVILTVLIALLGGYAGSRFEFKGKNALLFLILSTAMIPGIAILVPLYLIAVRLGIYNTRLVLVMIFAAWQIPSAIWIMRGFYQSIPYELEEAAYIDGCSVFQAFTRIVVPLTQPGIAAVSILVFIFVWNDFLVCTSLTSTDSMRLVQVGLYQYISSYGILWGRLMAVAMMALLPVLALFIVLQKRFIHGLTAGATKG